LLGQARHRQRHGALEAALHALRALPKEPADLAEHVAHQWALHRLHHVLHDSPPCRQHTNGDTRPTYFEPGAPAAAKAGLDRRQIGRRPGEIGSGPGVITVALSWRFEWIPEAAIDSGTSLRSPGSPRWSASRSIRFTASGRTGWTTRSSPIGTPTTCAS